MLVVPMSIYRRVVGRVMFMGLIDFVKLLGFQENPFAERDAEREELLPAYFVKPFDYDEVFGDPTNPQTHWIFAPRGAGKTAWRRMIERGAEGEDFLCITYDTFEFGSRPSLDAIDLNFHLENIIKMLTVALIDTLVEQHGELGTVNLSGEDKTALLAFFNAYIRETPKDEVMALVNSLKTFPLKIKEKWNDIFTVIRNASEILNKGLDLGPLPLNAHKLATSPIEKLRSLLDIAVHLGYKSVYVLVDKLDETQLTGNSVIDTAKFITPLAKDLNVQQMKHIAFKYFVWDKTKEKLEGARWDKVTKIDFTWTDELLLSALKKRLLAYSGNQVRQISDILSADMKPYIDYIIRLFAMGIPRNMVLIGKQILDKQYRTDNSLTYISSQSVIDGVDAFIDEYIENFVLMTAGIERGDIISLKRANRLVFQAHYIANVVLGQPLKHAEEWLKKLENFGLIEEVPVPSYQGATIKTYGVANACLARLIYRNTPLLSFIDKKTWICRDVAEPKILIRDFDRVAGYTCTQGNTAEWHENWFIRQGSLT